MPHARIRLRCAPRFVLQPVCAGVVLALGAMAGPAVQAQSSSAAPAAAPAVERIIITGSNIRRAATETPSPVLSLSAADIARSGLTSLSDVLHSISANNMGSLGQSTPGAFGAGGSGVSLRGLTVGATLVLIDGHRMASYPLPDDGQRDFVDIASIPIDAVERIEVLKDGASAVYGSDAIAGVVNVILKKSHSGTTLHLDTGLSSRSDGRSVKVSGIRGFGDRASGGLGGYLSASYGEQKPILLNQRPGLANSDWTPFGGEDLGITPNSELQIAPRTRTYSLLGKVGTDLASGWTLDLSASVLGSEASQVGLQNSVGPGGGITTFAFGPRSPLPQPSLLNGTNVIDPATGAPVDTTFEDIGAQRSRTRSQSLRLVAEVNGTWRGWDVMAAAGHTRVETRLTMNNFISLPVLQASLNSGAYVLGGTNSAAALAALTPVGESTSTNELNFIKLRASRAVAKLAGGDLAVSAGLEFNQRSLNEQFPEGFANGAQASNIYAFAVGKQTITAAYVEASAPVTKDLQIDAAARVDHYDTYGTSATPKLGLKYAASKALTLRGTYARGFRAPNPVEIGISGSSAGYLPPLLDTALCQFTAPDAACDIGVGGTQLQLPGQNLKPEKSRSFTLGMIFEPTPGFNLSVDYYDIAISDQIVSVGLFGQGQIDNPAAFGTQLYRVNSPTTPNAAPTSADDTILYGTYPFINVGRTRTNGVDIDMRWRVDAGTAGRFTPRLQWTRMFNYTIDRRGARYELAGTHGPSFVSTNTGTPRDRGAFSMTWQRGAVEVTGTVNHISGIEVKDSSYDLPDCSSALSTIFPNGAPAGSPLCRVPAFTTVNLSAAYQVTPQLSVRGSIANLFDKGAPIDAFASGSTGGGVSSGGARYNPSLHQEGAVGRYFNLAVTYAF